MVLHPYCKTLQSERNWGEERKRKGEKARETQNLREILSFLERK
jgi:hypothetical protein